MPALRISQIACSHCQQDYALDAGGRLRLLQRSGHLRKVADPHSPLVDELLMSQIGVLRCLKCSEANGLQLQWKTTQSAEQEDADWGVRLCQSCRQPMSRERLAAMPKATHCVACLQSQTCASACDTLTDESCPRCGQWLHLGTRRSSLRTHFLTCPGCGYKDDGRKMKDER